MRIGTWLVVSKGGRLFGGRGGWDVMYLEEDAEDEHPAYFGLEGEGP